MAITFLAAADFTKIPALQFVVPVVSADPTGYEAGLIYNSVTKELKYHNGTTWVTLGSSVPSGPAGGDLSGTYPNPQIAAGVIVDADVAAANKDGAAATPSMRTLGTGANQAAPGNDSRFTDSRPPTGTAGGDLSGTYPNPQIAAGVIVDADVAAANKDGAVATPSLRTLGMGAQQALAGNTPLNAVTAPAADVSLNSKKITNLLDPASAQDAATKAYVDAVAQGLDAKQSVRVATTANITLSGTQTIDGVPVTAGQRVLVKNQTTGTQNGIYLVSASAWTRAPDLDANAEFNGAYTFVEEGAVNNTTGWICSFATGNIMGVDPNTWTQFSGAGQFNAGAGLTKTGNTVDVVGDANLSIAADIINVLSAPKWTTARTITLGTDLSGSVAIDGSGNVTLNATVIGQGGGAWPTVKKSTFNVPAGTSCVINHNMATTDVMVEVFRVSAPGDTIQCDVERTNANTVTLKFATAVAANAFRCMVIS